jgi:hypothetical protein
VLIPLFGIKKGGDAMVKLDEYVYDYENKIIKCIIKVKNVSFQKRVFARISFNNWKNYYDLDAIYITSENAHVNRANTNSHSHHSASPQALASSSTTYDKFGFCIVIPEKNTSSNVDIASKPLDD